MNIERRIDGLERQQGIGGERFRLIHASYTKREDYGRAMADAIARDDAERGPLHPSERHIILACGPAGHWIDTPGGARWQYPDGTTTDDPTGARSNGMRQ